MKHVKQAILIRRDLKLPKSQMAAFVATASMRFLITNNESIRGDELFVKLSQQEVEWINQRFTISVFGVPSQDALRDISFKAEMAGLPVYTVYDVQSENDVSPDLLSVAIGPDEDDLIDRIIGNLKLI